MNDPLYENGVLLITPYHRSQRGNTITTGRITSGLRRQGIPADLFSMEQEDWAERLEEQISRKSYALVHAFHISHLGRLLEKLPGLRRYPLVLTVTGTDIHVDLGRQYALAASTLQSVSACIVFNRSFIPVLIPLLQGAHIGMAVIAQGVDLPVCPPVRRSTLGLREDDVVFLMPTGLRPVKNIEMVLEGLEQLATEDQRVKLLLIGPVIDPHYGARILERIRPLPWVSYLGEIPHDRIAGFMAAGDVVLNCSHSEGQPQAALEAMSLGIPAILSQVPGNTGIIEEGREGCYVSDGQDLAKKGRLLLNHPEQRRRMGLAARSLIERSFDPVLEIEQHIQLYRDVLQGG